MAEKNKTVILTGGSGGIGRALIKVLSEEKNNLWVCARKSTEDFTAFLNDIKKKNKHCIIKECYFDLSDLELVKKSAQKIISEEEEISGLVNIAGAIHSSVLLMTSLEVLKKIFDVNFFSQVVFTQIILKKMIAKKKGSIVNISSTAAEDGVEGRSAYSSSKAAINGLTKVLSKELSPYNVRVNAIAPGLTNTKMMKDNHDPEKIKKFLSNVSLKRIAEPEEIANVIEFLLSEKSSYLNGQIIRVDGGI